MKETDLLSIKKFAEFSGIKQSVLRYYDEIGLFSPIHRGENGYRYYSPQQLITVKQINVLSNLRTSLKDISELEKKRSPKNVLDLLIKQESKFDLEMHQLQVAYSITHMFRKLIQTGLSANEHEISDCEMNSVPIIMGPINDFGNNQFFYETFIQFCQNSKNIRINLSYPVGGYFETINDFIKEPSRPTRFFSLDPSGYDEKHAGRYLVGYSRGYYGHMGNSPERLIEYAKQHNLVFNGPLYVIYLHDQISIKEPSQYLAQFSIPITDKKINF